MYSEKSTFSSRSEFCSIQAKTSLKVFPKIGLDCKRYPKPEIFCMPGSIKRFPAASARWLFATVALAAAGLLDHRPHTSNGVGFLDMFCPGYRGQRFYVGAPSVADGNLITAGTTGGLLWAKQIIERLGVFQENTLASWYDFFRTGEAQHFFALMNSLPASTGE